jgi:hypothetical protein
MLNRRGPGGRFTWDDGNEMRVFRRYFGILPGGGAVQVQEPKGRIASLSGRPDDAERDSVFPILPGLAGRVGQPVDGSVSSDHSASGE